MPLEDEIRALTEAVKENNELLRTIVNSAKDRTASAKPSSEGPAGDTDEGKPARRTRARSTDDGDKPARSRASKDTDEDKTAPKGKDKIKADELKAELSDWVGEYDEKLYDEDGNELDDADEKLLKRRKNRLAFVKLCYRKLEVANIADITKQDDLLKLRDWVEQKKAGNDPFEDDAV